MSFSKQFRAIISAGLMLLIFVLPVMAESTEHMAYRMLNCYFYEQAYPMFLRLVKQDPNNPEYHYDLARCLDWDGPKLRAIKEFQIYLDLAPNGSHAQFCHSKVDAWNQELLEKGEKYVLSNRDMWFEDHYKHATYHSWDENPKADWVIKLEEKKKNERTFGVDVHFACPYLSDAPDDRKPQPWQGWLLRDFHANWQKSAKAANALGTADLYIRMQTDGRLEPIIVMSEGNDNFEKTLLAVLASYSNQAKLKEACNEGYVIKAQIGASMKSQYASAWYAFSAGGPGRPFLVTLNGTFKKHTGFETMTTSALVLPKKTEAEGDPTREALKADDETQMAAANAGISNEKYSDVIDILWPLGERDIPQACLALAKIYSDKDHKWHDNRMAAIWWEKAAELGIVEAQYMTGCIYEWGDGNSTGGMPDAVKWYQVGAKNGSAQCALKLAILNEFGDGIPPDQKLAIYWYKIAAAKGQQDAVRALSRLR